MYAGRSLTIVAVAVAAAWSCSAMAQTPAPVQGAPNMPSPQTTVPEKVGPDATGSTTNLSEKLNRSDGVITPPAGLDSGMTTKAPSANTGSMPVITPPGEPGGNQAIQPK